MVKDELSPAEKAEIQREYFERLNNDFEFFASKYCKIKDNAGNFVPFVLNPIQKRLTRALNEQWERRGLIRIVINKARQQGFSTYFQAYVYWRMRQKSTHNAFIVAQDLTTSKALFKNLQDTHNAMPERLRPKLAKSSVREMVFKDLNTSIEVDTPSGGDVARGRTIHCLWISELAYWSSNFGSDSLAGILACVHNVPGTIVVCESTAKGVSGAYYDLWSNAPANGFEQFFAPWYELPSYRDDNFPAGFGGPDMMLTEDEIDLRDNHGCDLAQIWWRRTQLAKVGQNGFLKDYPATPEDAFLASGSPVFSPIALQQMAETATEVETTKWYNNAEDKFEEDFGGHLTVFEEPKKGREYFIGADVAHGLATGDYSVAQVLDDQRRQVAVYRAKVSPEEFALVLNRLGHDYNEAKIILEVNSLGHTTMVGLKRLNYYNMYRRVLDTKLSDETKDDVGFVTNKKTKPLIIYNLQEHIRSGSIKVNHDETLSELREFKKHVREDGGDDDSARLAAPRGKHDDTVMALALANFICEDAWEPIPDDVLDGMYLPSY